MKKLLILLLLVLLCLSCIACGNEDALPGNSEPQQGSTDDTGANEIDWKVQICNSQWYLVGAKAAFGMVFEEDGTTSGCTWEIVDNKVIMTAKDGDETWTHEIRTINGIHFLVGLTDGITYYQWAKEIDWSSLPVTAVEITMDNWQDYFEIVNVDDSYHLQMKNSDRQALLACLDEPESCVSFCYSQGDVQSYTEEINFYWGEDYIDVNNPEESPIVMKAVEGTLYLIDGLK